LVMFAIDDSDISDRDDSDKFESSPVKILNP